MPVPASAPTKPTTTWQEQYYAMEAKFYELAALYLDEAVLAGALLHQLGKSRKGGNNIVNGLTAGEYDALEALPKNVVSNILDGKYLTPIEPPPAPKWPDIRDKDLIKFKPDGKGDWTKPEIKVYPAFSTTLYPGYFKLTYEQKNTLKEFHNYNIDIDKDSFGNKIVTKNAFEKSVVKIERPGGALTTIFKSTYDVLAKARAVASEGLK